MKRIIAWILAAALLLSAASALADDAVFSSDFFEQNDKIFTLEVDKDNDAGVVTANSSAEGKSFSTPYDSESYFSMIFPELIIGNYSQKDKQIGVFRIWIRYNGTKFLNIHSVSFIIDGVTYDITEISDPSRVMTRDDGTCTEVLLIKFGKNCAKFVARLCANAYMYMNSRYGKSGDKSTEAPKMTMILHGDEDIEVTVPDAFWDDMGVFAVALNNTNGYAEIGNSKGSPCTVTGDEDGEGK